MQSVLFVAGSCSLAVTIPGTMEILLVTTGALRKRKARVTAEPEDLRMAIVIPAHNESALIARCVASVAASARHCGNCEVIVIADNCTDDTATRAMEAGARVMVRENAVLRGKGYALRLAFDHLQTEGFGGFLVVDADSVVTANLVTKAKRRLAGGSAALQCSYRVLNCDSSVRTRLMDAALLAFNVMRPKGRSGWGLSAGILGNGFALRSETLQKVPWDAASVVEDLEYHLRLVATGERVDFIEEATVFGEMPSGGAAARAQRSRWEGGRLRMVREWAPRLMGEVANGKSRLLEPLLELLMFPLAYHVLLLTFACVALPDPFRRLPEAALGLTAVHVIWASFLGGQPLKNMAALAAAPFYILWKVTTLGSVVVASRRSALWKRTVREDEVALRTVK